MNQHLQEIEKALTKYNLKISRAHLQSLIKKIDSTQQYFPVSEQHALVIKLITDWESKKSEKIITAISESFKKKGIPCITTFGILSVDWPGFSDTCLHSGYRKW